MRPILLIATLSALPSLLNAQNHYELAVNNVRARFHSNGLIGMNIVTHGPEFEVPNSGGAHPLFSAGLWIGGLSPDNMLHLAAMCYEPLGWSDWYPGPLTPGAASNTVDVQTAYDQVWPVDNNAVLLHQQYCACMEDPGCDVAAQYPGYQPPLWFSTWPAMRDTDNGYAPYQAPFIDHDDDGLYQPADCDRPCVPGDEALFFIFNDQGPHQNTQCPPIGVEVQAMPFAYAGPSGAIANTVFVEYRVINRGSLTLNDAHISLFTDFDLGCYTDDRVGCDVGRSLWYVYNGDAYDDQGCGGATGYGAHPPAFGAVIICGPPQDLDALDNPLVADYEQAATQLGALYPDWGFGYGDGVVDNERLGLGGFTYYSNNSGDMGNPVICQDYYNSMRGLWNDASPLTYGGNGHGAGVRALYAFPDDSDPLALGTIGVPQTPWSEVSAGNAPSDRRGVGTMGPLTLEPGDEERLLIAFTFARSDTMNSVEALKARVDSVRAFAMEHDFCSGVSCLNGSVLGVDNMTMGAANLLMRPVPTSAMLTITVPGFTGRSVYRIMDSTGRHVRQGSINAGTVTLDVSDLAPGTYTCTVLTNDRPYTGRFIKE